MIGGLKMHVERVAQCILVALLELLGESGPERDLILVLVAASHARGVRYGQMLDLMRTRPTIMEALRGSWRRVADRADLGLALDDVPPALVAVLGDRVWRKMVEDILEIPPRLVLAASRSVQ